MLTHPTTDRLREMGLAGMARALEEQRRQPDNADLGFEDRLAMLVDREVLERDTKRLAARMRFVGLRQQATPEDIDHRAGRGLDRALFQRLTGGEWIERHQDLLVTGPTGTGKTWLSRSNRLFDLRAGPPRLPGQPLRALPARAAAAGGAWPGTR